MTDPVQTAAAGIATAATQVEATTKGWLSRNRDWLWAVVIALVVGVAVGHFAWK